MIAVYADHRGIQQLIESQISDIVHLTAKDRSDFGRMMGEAQTGIVGTLECSSGLVRYLRSTFRLCMARGPTCIVVTRVSFDNLRSLQLIECDRLHVVWVEEVEEQLHQVLNWVAPSDRDPFRSLGPTSSWASSLSPAMARAVRLIRAISHDHYRPPISVSELAKQVNLDPWKLGYSWRAEMPLRCTLKADAPVGSSPVGGWPEERRHVEGHCAPRRPELADAATLQPETRSVPPRIRRPQSYPRETPIRGVVGQRHDRIRPAWAAFPPVRRSARPSNSRFQSTCWQVFGAVRWRVAPDRTLRTGRFGVARSEIVALHYAGLPRRD